MVGVLRADLSVCIAACRLENGCKERHGFYHDVSEGKQELVPIANRFRLGCPTALTANASACATIMEKFHGSTWLATRGRCR
jgi:hypothetical protein